jgi:hypothetical protein
MHRLTTTALALLLALSAAGCAVELPGSALGGFRLAPPDDTGAQDTAQRPKTAKPRAAD